MITLLICIGVLFLSLLCLWSAHEQYKIANVLFEEINKEWKRIDNTWVEIQELPKNK
jgi:hypothetical protein